MMVLGIHGQADSKLLQATKYTDSSSKYDYILEEA